jgi:hypothetical protein
MNLAFVLLADARLPKDSDIVDAFVAYAHGEERLVASGDDSTAALGALQFELTPGGTVIIAAMDGPVPNREADQAAHYSVSAFGTGWELPAHGAHLVVMLRNMDPAPTVAVLSAFTSFLAAVAKASQSVGIYWGEAGATHDAGFFCGLAAEPEAGSRMMLWTGLTIGAEADERLGLLSLGMKQLALPDLLLVTPRAEANDAIGTFFELLGYVAALGRPLTEGETVGRSAAERLPVRYVPSPIDADSRVWRVELP